MITTRIIPRLDIKGPNVVKGIRAEGLRVVGIPQKLAKRYYEEGADEILYMDVVASLYQRSLDFDLLRSVADEVFVPLTVGGGIRSLQDITNVLRAGADKVAINTYAVHHPDFLASAVERFGAQCIVLSLEAKENGAEHWEAYTDGGREHSGVDAVAWTQKALDCGVGEILLTSVDRDGTRQGFDLELLKSISSFAKVPIVIHGGAGSTDAVLSAIQQGADAVAISSMFHYGEATPKSLKQDLSNLGCTVRL